MFSTVLILAACGAAPRPRPRSATSPPPAIVARPAPPAPPTRAEIVARERLRLSEAGASLVAERAVEASEHLHLVLEAGRCYELVAIGDGEVRLDLRDEHDREISSGVGRLVRLSAICPRWTGSYQLRADAPDGAEVWLLLAGRGGESAAQPSASSER